MVFKLILLSIFVLLICFGAFTFYQTYEERVVLPNNLFLESWLDDEPKLKLGDRNFLFPTDNNTNGTAQSWLITPISITQCYGTKWVWEDSNETNCKCSNTILNYSNCDSFIEYKYCTNDWDGILESEMFSNEINPYLKYNCETGDLLDSLSSGGANNG